MRLHPILESGAAVFFLPPAGCKQSEVSRQLLSTKHQRLYSKKTADLIKGLAKNIHLLRGQTPFKGTP
jgi:hypothetical protein